MSEIKRKSLLIFLSIMLLAAMFIQPLQALEELSCTETAANPNNSGIDLQWQNAESFTITLDCSDSTAYIHATIVSVKGTTYKNGTVTLEKISGSNCGVKKTWNNLSGTSRIFSFHDESVSLSSGTYKLTVTIDTVRNGSSETITASKTSKH